MPQYRIPELDLSIRIPLAVEMLLPIPMRPWGRVTELAQSYGVSRVFLYQLRDRALEALMTALAPRQAGPASQAEVLVIDQAFLRRATTVLALLKGTVRDIQRGLELLFDTHRSVGYISQTLQQAGTAAAAQNDSLWIPLPVLGEADEVFQGRRPCLSVVDGRSFLVLHLAAAQARDATTWGLALLELQERGVQFHDLVSDGAKGIQAGVQEAQLMIPLRPDLFHVLREAHRLSQRLERAAYRAIKVAEHARRAEREAQAPRPRRGRRLKVKVPREQAEAEEDQAISLYDGWCWLIEEMRQALEPIQQQGRLTTVAEARATVETALELLQALDHAEITAFAHKMLEQLEALLAPLAWLENSLAPWRAGLDPQTEALIVWSWQHREALALQAGQGFPTALQPVVQAFWEVLSLFHRSSSLAESLHSWLRPYLQIHRGAPRWLLPLLQWLWNHHSFQRGKRAGKSPLELAGVEAVPALPEALDRLLLAEPQQECEPPFSFELPFGIELTFGLEPVQVMA